MFAGSLPARAAAVVLLGLLLGACGGAGSPSPPPSTAPEVTSAPTQAASVAPTPEASQEPGAYDPTMAALVPSDIAQKGTINVATEGTYPPYESIAEDGTTIIGLDPDLVAAAATVLGLKVQMVNVPFDSIIPGLQAGRYDLAASDIGDNKKREDVVDFVDVYRGGTEAAVKAGNPLNLTTETLCGVKVAVERASTQQTLFIPQIAELCKAAGKPGPIEQVYKGLPEEMLALSSGRVEAVLADALPVEAYAAENEGQFTIVGPFMPSVNPAGFAFPKGSGLVQPMASAMQRLMDDGTYAKILEKWKTESVAIPAVGINGATQ